MSVGEASLDFLPVPGVRLAAASAGLKSDGVLDTVLFEFAEGAVTAGVFTQSHFAAAPVQLCRERLEKSASRYFLINSGNANAATGDEGIADAETCCNAVSQATGSSPDSVLPFSTGVIGERLPVEKITNCLLDLSKTLDEANWLEAAHGIMTTDTRPKIATRQVDITGRKVTITGIAKGAGMIQPNMATMLAYIATDVVATRDSLQTILESSVEQSFNRITVDSDTSTNDSCMLTATGVSGVDIADEAVRTAFVHELDSVMRELAQGLVRDGEGATKFVSVTVEGGPDQSTCLEVAYAVANSPLMKTALFASDANWGRIVMAIGKARVALDVSKVDVFLGELCLMRQGGKDTDYTEERGAIIMAEEEIVIRICLNAGDWTETVWTSDLSHEYVRINAEYRT